MQTPVNTASKPFRWVTESMGHKPRRLVRLRPPCQFSTCQFVQRGGGDAANAAGGVASRVRRATARVPAERIRPRLGEQMYYISALPLPVQLCVMPEDV